jgi:dTDP-4-dehydrorhamnose 3,5-epimerase-like enzyme
MVAGKYGKYFITEPIGDGKFAPLIRFSSEFAGTNFSFRWHYITGPWLMEEKPHAHDFDQFTCFMGGNPTNVRDFGAEVEMFFGEEQERYVINTTTILYVPKGLVHGPLSFKRVDRPVMFINIPLTSQYVKKEITT